LPPLGEGSGTNWESRGVSAVEAVLSMFGEVDCLSGMNCDSRGVSRCCTAAAAEAALPTPRGAMRSWSEDVEQSCRGVIEEGVSPSQFRSACVCEDTDKSRSEGVNGVRPEACASQLAAP